MIYTVTLNPSLDYVVTMKDFTLGKTNRTTTEQMFPGGKGINVSIMLKNLGIESTVLGFTAGFVGEEIERKIKEMGLGVDFIRVQEGASRINVKLKDFEGTEINGQGPEIGACEAELLMKKLDVLQTGDILVLAGSVAKGMKASAYRDIMERLSDKGILFVVDASGETLLDVLPYHPFLIKPNNHELGELFRVTLQTRDAVVTYAKMLQEKGARNVLVSLAGEGAVLVTENGEIYKMPAPQGTLVNAVGAGDSMVAGFLAGWLEAAEEHNGSNQEAADEADCPETAVSIVGTRYEHAFRLAVAAGSASAYSENLATGEEIAALYRNIIN